MFEEDLKEGKKAEREFARKLFAWDIVDVQLSQGKFPGWDVKAVFDKGGKLVEKTFEVKEDRMADKTGNVGIEYMYKGEPSGIYTSTADYIVYKIGDKFYYSDRLKLIIELSKCLKADVCGGDDDNSQMWLVRREVFNLLMTELGDKG